MQADHVRGLEQLGEERELHADGVLLVFAEPRDVVVLHVHVEGEGPARHLLADGAEPHDAEGLARQLVGARLGEIAHAPLAVHDIVVMPR